MSASPRSAPGMSPSSERDLPLPELPNRWVIDGSGHGPALNSDFVREVVKFFHDHPKQP